MTRIEELIEQGENSAIEFKSNSVSADSMAKEIVAFSNMSGGQVLIGVEDNKAISGINDQKNWEEWITSICRDKINPPVSNIQIQIITIREKQILHLQILKGKEKPYQTKNKNQFLIRVGSTNRVASQSELMRLFQESGIFHYDGTSVRNTSITDINQNKLYHYFDQYGVDIQAEINLSNLLANTDILNDSGELSVGGLLIFGINPQKYLPNASISFARFKGNVISHELVDKKNITGALDDQIDNALVSIKNNLLEGSVISGAKTQATQSQYPDRVFRELLVNACVHRDYSIFGSRIRVFMFDDRLEIRSPGRLPNTVTIEKMRTGVSYTRNPIILKFLENMRYVDKLGRGIPLVDQVARRMDRTLGLEEVGEEFVATLEL